MHPTLTYDLVRLEQQHAAQRSRAGPRARQGHPSVRRLEATSEYARPVAPVLRIATQRLV